MKQRRDLIPYVAEWADTTGRPVVEGLAELQSIVRSTRNPERQKKLLRSVEEVLSSDLSRVPMIALNLLKVLGDAVGRKVDTDAVIEVRKLTRSSSYRWLWSIRAPELKEQWRKKVRELAASPN